mgnify:CR=1 FL=1
MTRQHLIDNGYREYVVPSGTFYQKAIEHENGGKRYFIDVNYLCYTQPSGTKVEFWTPTMQVTLPNNRSVNIEAVQWYNTFDGKEYEQDLTNISEVEEFFEKVFVTLGAVDYR